MKTKEKILEAALRLFSSKGYEAISMEDIAQKVGIKAPSIYKHFKSKDSIFQSLIQELESRYQMAAAELDLDGNDPLKDSVYYAGISKADLTETGLQLFSFFVHDEKTAQFRRLLSLEQYRNPELAALYTSQYFDQPLAYHRRIFSELIQQGILHNGDPETMAVQFVSPILQLIALVDRDPEREEKARAMIRRHIEQFSKVYGKKESA